MKEVGGSFLVANGSSVRYDCAPAVLDKTRLHGVKPMKTQQLLSVLILNLVGFVLSSQVFCQDRAIIESVKASCFLAEVTGKEQSYATAFCVHPSGVVITNHHVVEKLSIGETINLIANAGQETQESFEAKLLRTDEKDDLAVLKILKGDKFNSIDLADSPEFYETMGITAFGFPFGKSLSIEKDSFPTISVNSGKITAIRKDKKEIQLLQLDATLNPGNSGGPVIDNSGKVIGIVSFGVAGAGVNFAIPSEKLRRLLMKPDIEFNIPEITAANYSVPKDVEVNLTPLFEEIPELSVEFWLKRGDSAAKKFQLGAKSLNKFQGTVAGEPDTTKKWLRGELIFKQGKIEGKVQDDSFKVDGKQLSLAQFSSLVTDESSKKVELSMVDGTTRTVGIQDLPKLKVELGTFEVTVDVATVSKVTLEPEDSESKISYIVIVKSKGKEISRSTGSEMERASDIGSANNDQDVALGKSQPAAFKGAAKTIPMPGSVTDAVYARGGQYLLVVLGVQKKLVVLNVSKASVEKILPLSSDDVVVVGTMNHIVVLDRKKNIIEKYGLDNYTRQLAVKPPFAGVVKSMVAGSASNGPILVHRAAGTDALANATFAVIDLAKFKELPVASGNTGHYSSFRDMVHMRASNNGRVFGMWCTSHSPSGVQSMILTDNSLLTKYEHDSVGHVVPNADGSHILTGAGVYSSGLKRLNKSGNVRTFCLPTSHPRFILTLPTGSYGEGKSNGGGIHEIGSDAALFNLPDLQLGSPGSSGEGWVAHDFTIDKRVFLNVESHALVSIPYANDSVLIQEFDVRKELRNSQLDYFFVSSTPNRGCTPGKAYAYQVEVESNRKKFKFEIASGPDKMTISPKGKVSWNVPRDFKDESVDVIVSISDGESLQTYDSFTIYNIGSVAKTK